jgi:hypothetical protein
MPLDQVGIGVLDRPIQFQFSALLAKVTSQIRRNRERMDDIPHRGGLYDQNSHDVLTSRQPAKILHFAAILDGCVTQDRF